LGRRQHRALFLERFQPARAFPPGIDGMENDSVIVFDEFAADISTGCSRQQFVPARHSAAVAIRKRRDDEAIFLHRNVQARVCEVADANAIPHDEALRQGLLLWLRTWRDETETVEVTEAEWKELAIVRHPRYVRQSDR